MSPELVEVTTADATVAAAVRRVAHRRVPGAGRHRRPGGAGARRGARLAAAAGAGEPADPEPGGVRRLPQRPGAARARATARPRCGEAVRYFEQAVALDSGFVAAWAALSGASSYLYSNGTPIPAVADRARSAAERALALDPQNPVGYGALGNYHRLVTANDATGRRAVHQGTAPSRRTTSSCSASSGLPSRRWAGGTQAVEHLRRARSLDPRSATVADALGTTLLCAPAVRRGGRGRRRGDGAAAGQPEPGREPGDDPPRPRGPGRRAGHAGPATRRRGPADLRGLHGDLLGSLLGARRRPAALVKRLTPTSFDGDAGSWGLALAGVYEVEGDRRRAAAYGDSARAAFEQQLYAAPENAQLHALLGVALAYAGRKDAAIRDGERALALDQQRRAAGPSTSSTSSPGSTSWWASRRRRSTGWSRCSRSPTISRPGGSGSTPRSTRCGTTRGSSGWWTRRFPPPLADAGSGRAAARPG